MTLITWLQSKPFPNARTFSKSRSRKSDLLTANQQGKSELTTLRQAAPGCPVKIVDFSEKMKPEKRAHLQAYGVIPGHWVQITQHHPVTVIRIEHTEIALENELAEEINISQGNL